jgi:hypothetical protein
MMLVTILGLGRIWEQRIAKDPSDPLRYSNHAAYYNTTGVEIDGRLCCGWRVAWGKVRFNGGSGFNSNHPSKNLGKVFECGEPEIRNGPKARFEIEDTPAGEFQTEGKSQWVQVLFSRRVAPQVPDFFLVALRSEEVGRVYRPGSRWKSDDAYLLSCSVHRDAQELLILMSPGSWVDTEAGRLVARRDAKRFWSATLLPE